MHFLVSIGMGGRTGKKAPTTFCTTNGALSETCSPTANVKEFSSMPGDRRLLVKAARGLLATPHRFGSKTLKRTRHQHINVSEGTNCRYGEAQAAATAWQAHDGRRQRGTTCPHLYRYRLTHTYSYCSLARLPPAHPFVGAPILQRHFQVQWRARLPPPRVLLPHTCTQDGWFLQPKRRQARLPRRTVPSNCICM
jgi:hypothetical protein